jgi:tetratricopeptide (TPR) repeat protein
VPEEHFQFPRIETVEDAELALNYPRLSFLQCSECIQVFREAGRWRLHHLAAERAVQEGFGLTLASMEPVRVKEAALAIIDDYLSPAAGLDDLRGPLEEAVSWTKSLTEVEAFDPTTGEIVVLKLGDLQRLLILVTELTPACFLPMARILRQLDRSDIAIEVTTRVLDDDPDDTAALTTRGAAHTDVGNYRDATTDHQRAYRIDPDNPYLLNSYSRTLQRSDRLREALEMAKRAVEIGPSMYTARRLKSAAGAMGDSGAANEAHRVLDSTPDTRSSRGAEQLIAALAAQKLFELSRFEEVEAYLSAVADEEVTWDEVKTVIRDLRSLMEEERNRRQGTLDLDDEPNGSIEDDEGDEYEGLEPF